MKTLRLGQKVLVFISDSGRFNWAQHERDRALPFRKQFITYIGASSQKKIIKILKELEFEKYALRKGKRLNEAWEAKVYGLAWDDVRAIAPYV